jgi:hypothetical protein
MYIFKNTLLRRHSSLIKILRAGLKSDGSYVLGCALFSLTHCMPAYICRYAHSTKNRPVAAKTQLLEDFSIALQFILLSKNLPETLEVMLVLNIEVPVPHTKRKTAVFTQKSWWMRI